MRQQQLLPVYLLFGCGDPLGRIACPRMDNGETPLLMRRRGPARLYENARLYTGPLYVGLGAP